jgi:prepilin-type N-terminal cleavage/methylation domain-containing protein
MFRNRGGFTIIEVMIVLAVSAVLLTAVLATIKGEQNRTQFIQAMRDIDSKIQDSLNDVSTGNYAHVFNGGTGATPNKNNTRTCSVSGAPPTPSLGGFSGAPDVTPGINKNCLFLGEALQFSTNGSTAGVPNNTRFFAYAVLGRRLKQDLNGNFVPVDNFADANPTAMLGGGVNKNQELSYSYTFANGITARAIHYIPPGGCPAIGPCQYTLIGVYTNFSHAENNLMGASSDAAQPLQTYIYR